MLFNCLTLAHAGQMAEMLCVKSATDVIKGQKPVCETFEMHVTITADKDVGLQGALGIFAVSNETSTFAYWTEEKGWSPYSALTIIKPVEDKLTKIHAKHEYVVFKGSQEDLCKFTKGQDFNFYTWHVGLNPGLIKKYQDFVKKFEITGWQEKNFWNSILFYHAHLQKNVSLVYSSICSSTN